ncbi:MAG: UvrD-helicase domain-containing protein, partial [Oceanihabitans sp.]
ERMGEKFKHYFIDEFQDTSKLQWGNLKPLIENSLLAENLKQEQGTAMLVGDAKQAIYRWRGGEAEQFINLYTKKAQPFPIEQFVDNLPTNYRSLEEIIKFNNAFFKQVSTMVFSNADYKNLYYQGANQNTFKTEEGYVQLDFLVLKDQERDVVFPEKVLENIKFCQENNFQYKDICVLVRKKDQGVAIAQFLHAAGVPIISSETMLIFKSTTVQFINHVLQLLVQPNNEEIKILVLNFLVKKFQVEDKHAFFSKLVKKPLFQIFKALESYNIYINPNKLIQLPLYELVETIVQNFALVKKPNAYVQFYLDFVLTYSQKQGSNLLGFLEHAEAKKESLSIVAPLEQNAVQIMTIHKSKGLEFPVVIFPYADLNIYKEVEPKEWFPLQAENYQGFTCTLLNYNKKFGEYGEVGQQIYETHEAALELDNINLLYVACTRAVEQLFIVSNENLTKTKKEKPQTYAELFNAYLKANN